MSVVDSNPGSSYDLGTSAQYRNPSLTGSDIQEVSITDLISEGPIEGLVHGEGSVYLDGDTLEDKGNSGYNSNTVLEATAGQAYGEPKFISVPAASSNNGPVTCTHKDASGTTAYFDNLEDTTSSDERYRWLRVHSIESTKVKIEGGFIYNERAQDANEAGMLSAEANTIYVCAVNDQGAEVDFFSQSQISAAQNRTWRYINLRSTIRITLPVSGQEIEGTVRSLFGADFDTADNSGLAKRAIIQLEGQDSIEVLKKGCPFNFNNLEKNNSINSIYNGIAITIDMLEDNPTKVRLFALRSFGESLYHSITDASLEFGYKSI